MAEAYQFSRENRTVWWPVTINVPQDGGEVNQITIEMQLSIPKKDEARDASNLPQDEFEQYMLERVLDWKKEQIIDQDKNPIPFSKENMQALMQDQYFENGVTVALVKAAAGARVKN